MSIALTDPARTMMNGAERAATEAYRTELRAEFRANAQVMKGARMFGNVDAYLQCVAKARSLYQEIAEVEVALMTGALPF